MTAGNLDHLGLLKGRPTLNTFSFMPQVSPQSYMMLGKRVLPVWEKM